MTKSRSFRYALAVSLAGLMASPSLAQSNNTSGIVNNTVQNTAVLITSHDNQGEVSKWGETLFGNVLDPDRHIKAEVTIPEIDHTIMVDVGAERGQFAVRLFPWMFSKASGTQLTVVVRGIDSNGIKSDPARVQVSAVADRSGTISALNRISFGATPELYDRVRRIGFGNYVREQLNPDRNDDPVFFQLGYRKTLSPKEVSRNNPLIRPNRSDTLKVFGSQAYVANYNLGHALYSKWQLNEIMTRFWSNHFHTVRAGNNTLLYEAREWNGFRKRALSSFEELLMFSAHSPTMQSYLDNDLSTANGLNENYARELLELHTVGVDSSYGDEDIIEVAKILTGWGTTPADASEQGPVGTLHEFKFRPRHHVTEDKVVPFLGEDGFFKGLRGDAGVREGRNLLRILAQHSDTKTFVCGKLVNMLVADGDNAQFFVNKCRNAWTETDGQIKPILEAILLDTNYAERGFAGRGKVRTGLEYAIAVGRAFDIRPRNREIQQIGKSIRLVAAGGGYDFLAFATPDGLPENGRDWISSGTMVSKFNAVQGFLTWNRGTREFYNVSIVDAVQREGLETAEEVADYLLTLMTGGRYRQVEYKSVVRVLKGDDGVFHAPDDADAISKVLGLVAIVPTAQLQ